MIQKYTDDTVCNEYRRCIEFVDTWYLNLNISKTKEILWDFRRVVHDVNPRVTDDKPFEIVHSYKYHGLIVYTMV